MHRSPSLRLPLALLAGLALSTACATPSLTGSRALTVPGDADWRNEAPELPALSLPNPPPGDSRTDLFVGVPRSETPPPAPTARLTPNTQRAELVIVPGETR